LSSLGDGAAGDSSGGDGEGPLVEEEAVVIGGNGVVSKAEEVAADEAVGRGTEGESEAEEVVGEATGGGVEDVGEHDVHGVLCSDGSCAEHGETKLHGEDQIRGEKKVGVVDCIGGVANLSGNGIQLVTEVVGGGCLVDECSEVGGA